MTETVIELTWATAIVGKQTIAWLVVAVTRWHYCTWHSCNFLRDFYSMSYTRKLWKFLLYHHGQLPTHEEGDYWNIYRIGFSSYNTTVESRLFDEWGMKGRNPSFIEEERRSILKFSTKGQPSRTGLNYYPTHYHFYLPYITLPTWLSIDKRPQRPTENKYYVNCMDSTTVTVPKITYGCIKRLSIQCNSCTRTSWIILTRFKVSINQSGKWKRHEQEKNRTNPSCYSTATCGTTRHDLVQARDICMIGRMEWLECHKPTVDMTRISLDLERSRHHVRGNTDRVAWKPEHCIAIIKPDDFSHRARG